MPQILSCPRGHQWEYSTEAALFPASGSHLCPVCGASCTQETLSAGEWPSLRDELPPAPPVTSSLTINSANPSGAPAVPWPAVPGYEILGELGRGGMGVVYQARQENLGRLVALKMLRPDSGAGPEELARFRREAESVAGLRHANFVHIYDIGEQDGRPFFALEFVEGGSLASQLAQQLPQPDEAARLVETLARAMHVAHQNGIVHRDLKPANILLMSDGNPKIADFGLARKQDTSGLKTHTGAILGTPCYMAP